MTRWIAIALIIFLLAILTFGCDGEFGFRFGLQIDSRPN
jgi:hypothetical protein